MVVSLASTVAILTSAVVLFDVLDEALHLTVGSDARLNDLSFKSQVLTSQRVVQVHFHLIVSDVHYASEETVAVLVLQRHNSILVDVLVVEMVVDGEDALVDVDDALSHILAIGFLLRQRKLEVVAHFQFQGFFLEGIQRHAESRQEAERFLFRSRFNHFVFTILCGVQFVAHHDVLMLYLIHFLLCYDFCSF